MTLTRLGILTTACCMTLSAFAQEFEPGVHGAINLPVGDLGDALDHRPGVQVGGHLGMYFGNGHEVRPRVDFSYYDGGEYSVGGHSDSNRISAWGLGCDYLYYTARQPQGLYLTGGLGYQWWDVSPDHAPDSSHSGLSMAAGAGYRFNRSFMLEGRFTTAQFRSDNGQANAFQAQASLRF